MPLPVDFDETFDTVTRLGITAEHPAQIRDHLVLAIRSAAEQRSRSGGLEVGDLGFIDWSTRALQHAEDAVRLEICKPAAAGLKDNYEGLFDTAGGDGNVKQIAAAITGVLATVHPALVVSTVVVYFALWLSRVGLNYWCTLPAPARTP